MTNIAITDLEDGPERLVASASWAASSRAGGRTPRPGRGQGASRLVAGSGSHPSSGAARARAAPSHAARLALASDRIVSGSRTAMLQYRDGSLLLGNGPEHDLWLVLGGTARLRGHETLPEHGVPARIEPNGLVRVLDRRVPLSAVLRLAQALGAGPPSDAMDRAILAQRIPPGRYDHVEIEHDLHDYRVRVRGLAAAPFRSLAFEAHGTDGLLVPGVQEGALRRALVWHLTPTRHRLLLAMSLRGRVAGDAVRRIAVTPHVRRTAVGEAPG